MRGSSSRRLEVTSEKDDGRRTGRFLDLIQSPFDAWARQRSQSLQSRSQGELSTSRQSCKDFFLLRKSFLSRERTEGIIVSCRIPTLAWLVASMSSFADQMDAEDSSHSLLSRRQSEMGSHYVYESGVYMSSFASIVFVAALVTIGVLMLTLLVALTVMLNSCQSRSTGIIERFKTSDGYDYCNAFAFHAELNNLEANEVPSICMEYGNLGQFVWDLNLTVQLAESYFSTLKPTDDHLDVILMDVDEIFLPGIIGCSNSAQDWRKHFEHENPARKLVLRLYLKLQASGWTLILFTRKHSRYRNDTAGSLISAGYGGWSSLIMRSDDELPVESWEYISGRRLQLLDKGYRIASIISSQMDAFRGSNLGIRNFKLANPTYYSLRV